MEHGCLPCGEWLDRAIQLSADSRHFLEAIVEHLPEFAFNRHDRMINFIFETSATAEVEVDKVCGTLISDRTVVVSLFDLEVSSSPHFFIN